jgi:hypothetical protein
MRRFAMFSTGSEQETEIVYEGSHAQRLARQQAREGLLLSIRWFLFGMNILLAVTVIGCLILQRI